MPSDRSIGGDVEDVGDRFAVRRLKETESGHVGLPHEEEDMKFFRAVGNVPGGGWRGGFRREEG